MIPLLGEGLEYGCPFGPSLLANCGSQGPGKKWEHYETNDNGKVVRFKIHVKKGDTVQCIAGVDKGKVGVVQKVRSFMSYEVCVLRIADGGDDESIHCCAQVLPKTGQLIVENINVKVSVAGLDACWK